MSGTRYRVAGDTGPGMTATELLFAAEVAFAGGLLEEMPSDAEEAMDAFDNIDMPIEEVTDLNPTEGRPSK